MHFLKEIKAASSSLIPVETAVRMPAEGLTIVTVLLRTDLDDTSSFSLSVTLHTENTDDMDSRFLKDITRDPKTASEIFQILRDGMVTPCTVSDILEDIL